MKQPDRSFLHLRADVRPEACSRSHLVLRAPPSRGCWGGASPPQGTSRGHSETNGPRERNLHCPGASGSVGSSAQSWSQGARREQCLPRLGWPPASPGSLPRPVTSQQGLRGSEGGAGSLPSSPAFFPLGPWRGPLMDGYLIRPERSREDPAAREESLSAPLLPTLPGVCFTN